MVNEVTMVNFTLRIEDDLDSKLVAEAEQRGLSKARLIQLILTNHFSGRVLVPVGYMAGGERKGKQAYDNQN